MRDERAYTLKVCRQDGDVLITRGSGALIGEDLVLTARHVVGGVDVAALRVEFAGRDEPALVDDVLCADHGPDVALLRLSCGVSVDPLRAHTALPSDRANVSVAGYPRLHPNDKVASERCWPVTGHVVAVVDGVVHLDVTGAPTAWAGMSGAGVRVDGRVIAVLCQAGEDWVQNNRVLAVPLAALAGERWFADAVRGDDVARALDDLVAVLRAVVRADARAQAVLADVFAGSDADALVDGIRDGGLGDVLDAVNLVDGALHNHGCRPRPSIVRRCGMPWSGCFRGLSGGRKTSWRRGPCRRRADAGWCSRCAARRLPSRRSPVWTGKPCRFRALGVDKRLGGVGFVAVPAALRSPVRPTGARAQEAATEALGDPVGAARAQLLRMLGRETDESKARPERAWADAIDAKLRREASGRAMPGVKLRRSMVMLDTDHGDPDGLWDLMWDHIGAVLKELRFVRLTAPDELVGEHTSLAAPVEDLFARRATWGGDVDDVDG